jgi:hypothetical protein
MYSQVPFPAGVRDVRMKKPLHVTPDAVWDGDLVADRSGDTWCVWNCRTGLVEAVFHMAPNVHGWSASEAHAKSYLLRASPVDIAALDSVP